VGCWIALYLLLMVATDASSLVALISRFTEEAFATLIAVVFIVQSVEKVLSMAKYTPVCLLF
jgi:sodium bicarbonate cotransporter 8